LVYFFSINKNACVKKGFKKYLRGLLNYVSQ